MVAKYELTKEVDPRLGGTLAHAVIMQHVSRELIDALSHDLENELKLAQPEGEQDERKNKNDSHFILRE